MTDLVDAKEIERIVGVKRHPTEHWGRACVSRWAFFILHSEACRDSGIDLRFCPFSRALDNHPPTLFDTPIDIPVPIRLVDGRITSFPEPQEAEDE
jgi:hypothetical protein